MDRIEAYEFLNRRFAAIAEEHGIYISPVLGRGQMVRKGVVPSYFETYDRIDQRRWFSIEVWSNPLDVQAEPVPAGCAPHLVVLASDIEHNADLLWNLRCTWFNFDVDYHQAEKDVRRLIGR